jgi:hypothetical protein
MNKKQITVFTLGVVLSLYLSVLLHLIEIEDIGIVDKNGYMPIKHMADALLIGFLTSFMFTSIIMFATCAITFTVLNDDE